VSAPSDPDAPALGPGENGRGAVSRAELAAVVSVCAGNLSQVARMLGRPRGAVLRAVQDAGLVGEVREARGLAGTSGPAWRDPRGEAARASRAAHEAALRAAGGNLADAARAVGVSRACLAARVRSLGLSGVVEESRAERLASLERALVAAGGDPARAAVLLGTTPGAARARTRRAREVAARDALVEVARAAAELGCERPTVAPLGARAACGSCASCALRARARGALALL
jgi:hypothetical protein